jgi:paraquat-inducible protein B
MGDKSEHVITLPKPVIKALRRPVILIWIIPALAVLAAGYYAYDLLMEKGPEITVQFDDASGLKAGQSQVMHLGVEIGQVSEIQLSPDQKHVLVKLRLQRSATAFAEQGARFWVVRPQISAQSISGLDTVLSGPFIDTIPGSGDTQSEFVGLNQPPPTTEDGIRVVLNAPRLEHLTPDTPVYFRGIQVGVIEDIQLSSDATSVDVRAFIERRYAPLLKTESKFWVVSAVDVKAGLLSGVQMKVESFRSLLTGGIAFATPDKDMGDQAQDGSEFPLYDEPKPEWLDWAPAIPLNPNAIDRGSAATTLPQSSPSIQSVIGQK